MKEEKKKYGTITLIVASCDGFSDCWEPFFSLLHKYWPNCSYPIILGTQSKAFAYPGLAIVSSQIMKHRFTGELSWSERLLFCLELVESEFVLVMLDDYFISGRVDNEIIERCVQVMRENRYSHITLTEHGLARPARACDNPLLLKIESRAKYRVSTAPALWRVDSLRSYLRLNENIWQFEVFGSRRSWRREDTFFALNPAALSNGAEGAIPYFRSHYNSGIVRGKWQQEIKPFFEAHGITIDYSKRGWFKPMPRMLSRLLLARNYMSNPGMFLKGILGR